jgi:hypothetical protein
LFYRVTFIKGKIRRGIIIIVKAWMGLISEKSAKGITFLGGGLS